jgi:hypothetical protein
MKHEEFVAITDVLAHIRIATSSLGLLLNIVTFVIFSRKTFSKNAISVYCRVLALVDLSPLLILQYDLATTLLKKGPFFGNLYVCKLVLYLNISLASACGWILVAFSLHNLAYLAKIAKINNFLKKRANQYVIAIALVLTHLVIYCPIAVYVQFKPVHVGGNFTLLVCSMKSVPFWNVYNLVNFVDAALLPFCLMLVTTALVALDLMRSRNNLRAQTTFAYLNARRRLRKDRKFSLTSISMNILFIVLQSSITLYTFINFSDYYSSVVFFSISLTVFQLDFSTRFFVHIISNRIFRKEFSQLVTCGGKARFSVSSKPLTLLESVV